jgi:hypothetical protein
MPESRILSYKLTEQLFGQFQEKGTTDG